MDLMQKGIVLLVMLAIGATIVIFNGFGNSLLTLIGKVLIMISITCSVGILIYLAGLMNPCSSTGG